MTRLDQHIATVRNKLTLGLFIKSLAWIALGYGLLVWMVILAERLLNRTIPHADILFYVGSGATLAAALGYSFWRRPNAKMTAIAIDHALGLKEEFSTALYVRPLNDPFAMAAVKYAENKAANVSLYQRFPLQFPMQFIPAALVAVGALVTMLFMQPLHLFANIPPAPVQPPEAVVQPTPQRFTADQLPKIEASLNPMNDNKEAIKLALDQLALTKTQEPDPIRSKLNALQALENVKKALTEEMDKNEKFQTAMQDQMQLSQMDDAKDDSTPIGKAQNEIKQGKFDEAMNDIGKVAKNFEQMKPEEQKKTVEQAQALASALANAANNPQTEQKISQKLQQMGATPQQAKQMAQTMKQAAAGNPQAQQQVQQMANQIAKNANGGQGPTASQQQAIQHLMAQAQAMANSQAQAQSMAASANKMAQAMQGTQSKSGQGGQPGAGQQVANAAQQMQSQLQNMAAQSKNAQQMKDAAQAAADAASDAANGAGSSGQQANNQQGPGKGNGQGQGNNQQSASAGQGNQPGAATGKGPGGAQMPIAEAPFATKTEVDPGQENKDGKVLASRYVKAGIDPGHSSAQLRDVAASAEQEAPDEIDPVHISRDAQQAVKDYFSAMQNEQGQ